MLCNLLGVCPSSSSTWFESRSGISLPPPLNELLLLLLLLDSGWWWRPGNEIPCHLSSKCHFENSIPAIFAAAAASQEGRARRRRRLFLRGGGGRQLFKLPIAISLLLINFWHPKLWIPSSSQRDQLSFFFPLPRKCIFCIALRRARNAAAAQKGKLNKILLAQIRRP